MPASNIASEAVPRGPRKHRRPKWLDQCRLISLGLGSSSASGSVTPGPWRKHHHSKWRDQTRPRSPACGSSSGSRAGRGSSHLNLPRPCSSRCAPVHAPRPDAALPALAAAHSLRLLWRCCLRTEPLPARPSPARNARTRRRSTLCVRCEASTHCTRTRRRSSRGFGASNRTCHRALRFPRPGGHLRRTRARATARERARARERASVGLRPSWPSSGV